jgi:hypothetical protein
MVARTVRYAPKGRDGLSVRLAGLALGAMSGGGERRTAMLKVIGAGLGRTGTLSLKAALERLGFGPCYHMTELFQHPERTPTWEAALRGEPADWEAVFSGYRATVDWPGAAYYDRLMLRDPQRWYDSVAATIYQAGRLAQAGRPPGGEEDSRIAARARVGRLIGAMVWQGTFGGVFEDRERAIAVYEAHNREVQEAVPADKLLVFDVKEGWGPLCRFLDVPVPANEPFPHLNDAASFRQMVTQGRAGQPAPGASSLTGN